MVDVLYLATGTVYDLPRALGVGMRETRRVSDGTWGRRPCVRADGEG
jgi:hypothetical protein